MAERGVASARVAPITAVKSASGASGAPVADSSPVVMNAAYVCPGSNGWSAVLRTTSV